LIFSGCREAPVVTDIFRLRRRFAAVLFSDMRIRKL
jgi:hypothetical protein